MIQIIKQTNKQTNKQTKHFDNNSEDIHTQKKKKRLKYLEILLNYCYCRFSSRNTCNPKIRGVSSYQTLGGRSNVARDGASLALRRRLAAPSTLPKSK